MPRVLLALLLALSGSITRYDVAESVTATTPRGTQASALVGRVTVAGGRALWELTTGAFPRSGAQAALADRSGVTLLDTKDRIYAGMSREEFDGLFVPRAGAEGGTSFTPRDVAVTVEPEGPGQPFLGTPTRRFRVSAAWRIAVQAPGRSGSVDTKLEGLLVTAAELPDARSPFDGVLRLLPVRGDVREALERELSRADGLPVKVDLVLTSESKTEGVGPRSGTPDRPAPPPKTVTRIERVLSNPERRPAREADAALFAVPPHYHSRAIERLAEPPAAP